MRKLSREDMSVVAGGFLLNNTGGNGGSAMQLNAPIPGNGGAGILGPGGPGGNAAAQSQLFSVTGGNGGPQVEISGKIGKVVI